MAGPEGDAKNRAGKVLRLNQIRLATPSFEKIASAGQDKTPASANRRFEFDKRGQFFIGAHNVTLSVVALCVNNPDCLPLRING